VKMFSQILGGQHLVAEFAFSGNNYLYIFK
jgi:hypothetical protein